MKSIQTCEIERLLETMDRAHSELNYECDRLRQILDEQVAVQRDLRDNISKANARINELRREVEVHKDKASMWRDVVVDRWRGTER